MATQKEIKETREALGKLRKRFRQHGSRVHDETKQVWDAMDDALSHLVCGNCVNLRISITPGPSPTGQRVSLGCEAHLDPVKNWLGVFPEDADTVSCTLYQPT